METLFKKVLVLLVLSLSISTIQAGQIIPDPSNPFQIYRSNLLGASGLTHTLYFNFQLPTNSAGLGYKQLISAVLSTDAATKTALGLDTGAASDGTTTKFSCALYDITTPATPVAITVTALGSGTGDGATFNCRVEDLVNTLSAGRNYGLRLSLSTAAIGTISTFRQIALYTSSSTVTSTERIIIDYNPNFADAALYSDFSAQSSAPLAIASTTTAQTVAANTAFSLSFDLICNSYFRGSESNIVLQWDPTVVNVTTGATFTVTSANSTQSGTPTAIQTAYTGTLALTAIAGSTTTALLTGIGDDLVVNRTFKVSIAGFTTAVTGTSTASTVSVSVYYKNTYSIMSYSKFSLVNVTALSFTAFTVGAYDGWAQIRQRGAWNLQFSFTPSAAYASTGYVVIRHSGAVLNQNKLNFMSSTCDFSPMVPSVIASQNFGVRPICYPLRNDYNYKFTDITNATTVNTSSLATTTAGAFDGSGIFFQVPKLIAGAHTFNVFAFAENCSTWDTASSVALYNTGATTTYSGAYTFKLSFYKAADTGKLNEYRFYASNLIIANTVLTSPSSGLPCYSSYHLGMDIMKGGFDLTKIYYTSTAAKAAMVYREVNDFVEPVITTGLTASCTNCFFNNMVTATNTSFTFGSVLSTTTTAVTGSAATTSLLSGNPYVAVLGEIGMNNVKASGYLNVCNFLACAKIGLTTTSGGTTTTLGAPSNFKIEFAVGNKQGLFTSGD